MNQVEITDRAAEKIYQLLKEENDPNIKLRTFVQGGGCSGFQNGFTFDDEQAEDDLIIEKNGIQMLVDSMSLQYMIGAVIDFKEDDMGSSFVINNPNAQSTCGCGSSFSV